MERSRKSETVNFPNFEHHFAYLKNVRLHYVTLGEGEPVVLIHGWPETWYAWRRLMPLLADQYQLIAPDMRGLGDSSRPVGGYDKKTVAVDIWQLMHDNLRHAHFKVVGHDWGSPVAFRLAAEHPDAVTHLALVEIGVLGDQPESVFGSVVPTWWHLFFQVPDLPEALTFGRERILLEYMLTLGAGNPMAFSDDDIREYVRTYSQPGAMRAGFDYYRAANQDTADNRAVFAGGFKLPMPALGLGGGGPRGRGEAVIESLRRVAVDADGGTIPDCGHWVPEEKPQELADLLRSFWSQKRTKAVG
jgi:pimeloyl-ACP methyl ester carboxylesterase